MKELNLASNRLGQRDGGGNWISDMSGVIALGDAIPTMGALAKLTVRDNGLCNDASGQALAEMLKTNPTLKHLDISDNYGTSDADSTDAIAMAKGVADGLGANGALTSLDLANSSLLAEGAQRVADALKGHVSALRFDGYHFDLTSRSTAVVYQGGLGVGEPSRQRHWH